MVKKGSVFIYAIILVNIAIFLAFLVFTKSEILLKNADFQEYEYVMTRNIWEKSDLAVRYDKNVNSDGFGFRQTRCCPNSINVTWASTYNGPTTLAFTWGVLFCEATWSTNSLRLLYQWDYEYFSSGAYNGMFGDITIGASNTGIVSTASWDLNFTFALPAMCDIDSDLNSDNYSVYSTGSVLYGTAASPINPEQWPGDNDALAREVSYGYVKRNGGYYNIFFNPIKYNEYIENNTNNLSGATATPDPLHAFLSLTSTGYVYLDIDQPAKFKIIEFSSGIYNTSGELKRISEKTFDLTTSWYWFLQYSLTGTPASLSGVLWSTPLNNVYIIPEVLDFKNKLYWLFLSYSGATTGISDFLTYKLRLVDGTTGKRVYHVALDDSDPNMFKYLGYDILISDNGWYYFREMPIIRPK